MVLAMNIHPYCNCFSTGKFHPQDGYGLDRESGLWVHGRCRKPSKMNYDRMVNGEPQIPQPKVPEDFIDIERNKEAKLLIDEETDWMPQADDDDEWE